MSRWLDMRADVIDDICFQIDDLIEGYALGSLETDELLLVSDHIDRCPEAAERLHEYEETVGLLGLAVPAEVVSPTLWMRLGRATRPADPPANVTELKPAVASGIV